MVPSWVPPLVDRSSYGTWEEFVDACYACYVDDFIKSNPSFIGCPVKSKRWEPVDGRDHSFWHCIGAQDKGKPKSERNRHIKRELAERIRWPRPVIERAIAEPDILAWTEVRHGSGTANRPHLFLKPLNYVVVLEPRRTGPNGLPEYYFLWTTFLCEGRRASSLIKRYQVNYKLDI